MKPSKYVSIAILVVTVIIVSACGGSSGSKKSQFVEISSALRCAIRPRSFIYIPDNCMLEKIGGGSYVTDQNTIHLRGISSAVEDDGCPEPTFELIICIPTFPYNYGMSWINSTNGASGNGDVAFIGLLNDPVGWSTYDPAGVTIGYADPKGVPLEMGSNTIQINTGNSGLRGNAQSPITRVVDVTPPPVHSVDPEPGGTYGSRIVVYFSEQLDPASVVSAINVFDNNSQPVPGTSEFDPLKLKATWRPHSTLSPASSYTARISGVTDWAPNVMIDSYEWSFTTRP